MENEKKKCKPYKVPFILIGVFFVFTIIYGTLNSDDEETTTTTIQETTTTEEEVTFEETLEALIIENFGEDTNRDNVKRIKSISINDGDLILLINLDDQSGRDELIMQSKSIIFDILSNIDNLPSDISTIDINTFNDDFTSEMNGAIITSMIYKSRFDSIDWSQKTESDIPNIMTLYNEYATGTIDYTFNSHRIFTDNVFGGDYIAVDLTIQNNSIYNEDVSYYNFKLLTPSGVLIDGEELLYEGNENSCAVTLPGKTLIPEGEITCTAAFEYSGDGEYLLNLYHNYTATSPVKYENLIVTDGAVFRRSD